MKTESWPLDLATRSSMMTLTSSFSGVIEGKGCETVTRVGEGNVHSSLHHLVKMDRRETTEKQWVGEVGQGAFQDGRNSNIL